MKIDGDLHFSDDVAGTAARLEAAGYDGLWAAETGHDPLVTLALAAETTSRIQLGTGIVVAFGRSPLITATQANDVQRLSRGRLLLGVGSQIKPHIEKRYSMPWSRPAARMREYVLALRAIWSNWNEGKALRFRGEFYRHTLMTPFFSPEPHHYGDPKILLAAVGPRMTGVAGEVADGLLVHPFTTERYLREVSLPALEEGFARREAPSGDFAISLSALVIGGATSESRATAERAVREQIAFYASTPAYRVVLERHGWGSLQGELNELSRRGEWTAMGDLIDDDILSAFAVTGTPSEIAAQLHQRFGDVVTRVSLYTPYPLAEDVRIEVVRALRRTL